MIYCNDWWPWTKPDYITMTWRQSNNQWSGGIAAHPAPQKIPSAKIRWKSYRLDFWDQDGILLIDYLPKGQTIKAEYYSSLLMQLNDILKEKRPRHEKVTKGVLFLQDNVSTGTCNPEETGIPGLRMSWSPTLFSGSGPVGLPPVPWTEKTIESSPFFVWRGDLVGTKNSEFF